MSQKLITNFLKELKYRVDLKSSAKTSEEKVLLNTFKFFDLSNKNQSDFKNFLKVVRNLGMSNFSEDELLMAFEHYTRGKLPLNYREFISEIYERNVTLTETVRNESYYNTKSFTNSKYDTVDEWELVRKLINMMIYRLRKQPMFSFLNFFRDIRNFDTSNSDSISRGNFRIACQRADLELGQEDIDKVFDFFRVDADSMVISKFVECLCANYTDMRVQAVRKMFGRFDFNNQRKVNLGLVKETFNCKLHFHVKNGRMTQEEVDFQFNEYVSVFIRMNLGNLNLRSEEFLTFWKLLSAHVKRDMDFINFIENSFRYNELPRKGSNVQLRDTVQDTNSLLDKDFSVMSSGNIDEQEHLLRVELAKRGNKAMIVFYHNLRSNDYDGDGKVYIKEFENSILESRVTLPIMTVKKLFKAHARNGALDYQRFMSSLVFQFEPARLEMVKDLYKRFFTAHYSDSVPVGKVVEHFFPRGHPEFRKGLRQDYDLKSEFEESLRSFLMTYQGNQTHVSLSGFVRFMEFYCFLLNEDNFYYFIENGFKFKFFNRDMAKKEYISRQAEVMSRDVPEPSNVNVDRSTFNRVFGNKEFAPKPQPDQLRNKLPEDTGSIRVSRRGAPIDPQNYQNQIPAPQMTPSQFSPHDESVISRKSEQLEDLNQINSKLITANFKKAEVPKNDQFSGVLTSRLIKNIRLTGNFALLLEIEYEMTRKSDTGGNVDLDVFSSVLESVGSLTGFNDTNINDLFMSNLERGALHVQRFINDLRGQISEQRETWVIEKFDQLRNPATDSIHIEDIRKAFRAKQFKWRKQSVADVADNFQYMIDLFNCLNLAIKKTTEFDLDDFLYLFDNFSFMFDDDKDFKQMIDFCF